MNYLIIISIILVILFVLFCRPFQFFFWIVALANHPKQVRLNKSAAGDLEKILAEHGMNDSVKILYINLIPSIGRHKNTRTAESVQFEIAGVSSKNDFLSEVLSILRILAKTDFEFYILGFQQHNEVSKYRQSLNLANAGEAEALFSVIDEIDIERLESVAQYWEGEII